MTSFKIDSDIQAPDKYGTHKWPWSTMNAGQSYLIEGDETDQRRARAAALVYGKRNQKQFVSRKDKKTGRIRVWRIK